VVAGPRINTETLPAADGVELRGYVHELYRHAAVCDVAVVQGGLSTTMELVALQRPFISMPLVTKGSREGGGADHAPAVAGLTGQRRRTRPDAPSC
jgi:hypothetical protein